MGREITFPQVCEKRELGGGGWTQATGHGIRGQDAAILAWQGLDSPKAPPEQPELCIGSHVIYQGLEKAPLLNSHRVMLGCTLL